MVKEIQHFVAHNDPEETQFTTFQDAARHEERIEIADVLKDYALAHFDAHTEFRELTLSDWLELVACVQRNTPQQQ